MASRLLPSRESFLSIKFAMRTIPKLLVAALLGINPASGQVALTVSPSTISNTYPGLITLDITGLTNHETVTVQE